MRIVPAGALLQCSELSKSFSSKAQVSAQVFCCLNFARVKFHIIISHIDMLNLQAVYSGGFKMSAAVGDIGANELRSFLIEETHANPRIHWC
jgi:hypothetical protein